MPEKVSTEISEKYQRYFGTESECRKSVRTDTPVATAFGKVSAPTLLDKQQNGIVSKEVSMCLNINFAGVPSSD